MGGRDLDAAFWTRFAAIDNVVAIKVAPFNRYRTLAVMRGVAEAGAEDRITLYTGNDDHIVLDLVTPFTVMREARPVTLRFRGGLLGHWSVWTRNAVDLLARCRAAAEAGAVSAELLALDSRVTDCNAAFFDVAHEFAGCIAGCHEVLRRQGLLDGIWCLDPHETLSPGQAAEIDRVSAQHADLGRRRLRRRQPRTLARLMTAGRAVQVSLRNVSKTYAAAEPSARRSFRRHVRRAPGRPAVAGRPVRLRQDDGAENSRRAARC